MVALPKPLELFRYRAPADVISTTQTDRARAPSSTLLSCFAALCFAYRGDSFQSDLREQANGKRKKGEAAKITSWSIRADVVRRLERGEP